MFFTTHTVTGATIGVLSGNPFLAFIFGFLSHYILDGIFHFDQGSYYLTKDKGPVWLGADYSADRQILKKWHKRDWILLAIDIIVASFLFVFIFYYLPVNVWWLAIIGAFGGVLIDVLDVSPFWKKKFRSTRIGNALHRTHNFLHWPISKKYWYLGVGIQVVIIAVGMFILV